MTRPSLGDEPSKGWRWESYGGVELQVPSDWGFGTTDMPWCVARGARRGRPYVGRPGGAIPAILCPNATLSQMGDRYVWFGSSEPIERVTGDGGWIRETRVIGGVGVSIKLDDAAMVERILDSVRVVQDADVSGCPLYHALTSATGPLRPAPFWDVAAGDVVLGGSVCRYSLLEQTQSRAGADAPSALSGSRRLTAVEGAAIRDAVAAAPIGSGPNDPASCLPEVSRGDEVVVVTLETDAGSRELFVRYSGCDHNGVDDGTTHRILTPEIAASVFDASLLPTGWSGVLGAVFTPLWDAHRS